METFHEMYFDGAVDFKGDCLEAMEYRHDWAAFRFTMSLYKFFLTGMIPEVIMHTRSQGIIISLFTLAYILYISTSTNTLQTRNKSGTIMTVAMTSMAGSLVLA